MKNSIKYIIAGAVALTATPLLFSFKNTEDARSAKIASRTIKHHNITFAIDLSNRILPEKKKALHDTVLLNGFIEKFNPHIVKSGHRLINQMDIVRFRSINQSVAQELNLDYDQMTLDLARFEFNQKDRINYLTQGQYSKDIEKTKSELSNIYEQVISKNKIKGADIYSYLKNLSNTDVRGQLSQTKMGNTTIDNVYENTLVIFTDGYIEYGSSGDQNKSMCTSLSQSRVNAFRNSFNRSNSSSIEKFFVENNYGISPIRNPLLKDLKVIVMELDDRSLKNGNAVKRPTDAEILKLFWKDWLVKSGVRPENIQIHRQMDSKREAIESLIDFITS